MSHWGYPTAEDLQRIAERRQRVVALTHMGMTAAQIADLIGTTVRTVQRDRVAAGVAMPPPAPFADDELQRAQQLLADGCSFAEVARTLGRGRTTIRSHFPGAGWTREQQNAYISDTLKFRHVLQRRANALRLVTA